MASFSIFPDWRLILERGQQAEKEIEELDMDRKPQKTKNFRKRSLSAEPEDEGSKAPESDGEQEERRMALEEIKFLQRQREKKSGIPALPSLSTQTGFTGGLSKKPAESNHKGAVNHRNEGGGGDGDKDDLVLQDTFAQETAVMVEDPNMLKYIEKELAKQRGRTIEGDNQVLKDLKSAEDELYKIPEHLKVKGRGSGEGSTQWTTGIAEIQLPIEYKLRNIEETEAAKKLLQEKRLTGRAKSDIVIPSSYSADYFQRGRDYAEKLRRDHPELYKERRSQEEGSGIRPADSSKDGAGQRQAATDEFMMERFRKRERHRVMRR